MTDSKRQSTISSFLKRPNLTDGLSSKPAKVFKDDTTEKSPDLPAENDVNQPSSATPGMSTHRKTVRKLNNVEKWKKEFEWLNIVNEKMTCTICIATSHPSKTRNAFVHGSTNHQRSALIRHEESDEHRLSKKTAAERRFMTAAKKIVSEKYEPVLMAQLRTAVFMAKNNISDRHYSSLIDLQVLYTCYNTIIH